jgi:hypothetical protein
MPDAIEKTLKDLWRGPDSTPEIIIALERRGIRATEKRVLDAALELELPGSDVHEELYQNPSLLDKWWEAFAKREEQSAIELVTAKSVRGRDGVGKAKAIAGCFIADELVEKGHSAAKTLAALKAKGFSSAEIQAIRKEVGF